MHALTIIQPWAWAVAHAGKDVENRTWAPPAALIGQDIAIHAGKAPVDEEALDGLYEVTGPLVDPRWATGEEQAESAQGLWRLPEVVEAAVREQIARAA